MPEHTPAYLRRGGSDAKADLAAIQVPARSHWLRWAIFLGISWTWCIGMFLPVLLVRDYGLCGWIVFAIPNVVGAAAMGWTITAERSRAITSVHHELLDLFAIVTSGFQIFFIGWIANVFFGHAGWIAVAIVLVIAAIQRNLRKGQVWAIATATLGVSIVCAGWFLAILHPTVASLSPSVGRPLSEVALGSACFAGFALCPYLDPTFHRARQSLDGPASRRAFGVGFGVVFFAMIVFSLLYATAVGFRLHAGFFPMHRNFLAVLLMVHWAAQALVTIVFQTEGDGTAAALGRSGLRLGGAIGLALIGLLVAFVVSSSLADGGEFVYWLFMSCYGLGFPAYVWLCMIPGRGTTRPTRRMWTVTAVVIILAMPFYWLAFIDKRMPLVLIGVAIVLAARWFIDRPAVVGSRPGMGNGSGSGKGSEAIAGGQQNSAPTS